MISRKTIGLLPACLILASPAYAQDVSSPSAATPEAVAPATPVAPAEAEPPPPLASHPAETQTPAHPAEPQTPAVDPAPSQAAAPDSAAVQVAGLVGQPPEGKGQIVFYRPSMMGMAIPCSVKENDALVSRLGYGRYFVSAVEPGKHTYTVKSEARDVFPIEVEEGETYYVKCSIAMGIMVGRPNLSPSDQAGFDKVSAKLRLEPAAASSAEMANAEKPAS